MNYVISNSNSGIKLNRCGKPIACNLREAQQFDKAKAENVLGSIPKTLKKFNFKVNPVVIENDNLEPELAEDIIAHTVYKKNEDGKKVICNDGRLPRCAKEWIPKVKQIQTILDEADIRKKTLAKQLSSIDKAIVDLQHEIELGNNLNAREGYKIYKRERELLRERREVKDELWLLGTIQPVDLGKVDKTIENFQTREYTFRG